MSIVLEHNDRFVGTERRPTVTVQDVALQEGTRLVQGLIDELSALK